MSTENDYYGSGMRWFVGVVKDTQDPKNSNRVRVRIKGQHPDEGDDTSTPASSGTAGSTGSGGTSSTTPSSGTGGSSGAGVVEPDKASLPNSRQLTQKISNSFTLADLTVNAKGGHSSASARSAIERGQLTEEHIQNLARLARNCLDPLKQQYNNLIITSGWRVGIGASGNHPKGYAVDFQVPGVNPEQIGAWIKTNLAGRFSMLEIATRHVHIQLGGSGSTDNPKFIRGTSS